MRLRARFRAGRWQSGAEGGVEGPRAEGHSTPGLTMDPVWRWLRYGAFGFGRCAKVDDGRERGFSLGGGRPGATAATRQQTGRPTGSFGRLASPAAASSGPRARAVIRRAPARRATGCDSAVTSGRGSGRATTSALGAAPARSTPQPRGAQAACVLTPARRDGAHRRCALRSRTASGPSCVTGAGRLHPELVSLGGFYAHQFLHGEPRR